MVRIYTCMQVAAIVICVAKPAGCSHTIFSFVGRPALSFVSTCESNHHIGQYSQQRLQCLHTTSCIDAERHILALCGIYIVFVRIIYHVCSEYIYCLYRTCIPNSRTYIIFIQLTPRSLFRIAPEMTTAAVPASLGDPSGAYYSAAPCTVSKNLAVQRDLIKLDARQEYCCYGYSSCNKGNTVSLVFLLLSCLSDPMRAKCCQRTPIADTSERSFRAARPPSHSSSLVYTLIRHQTSSEIDLTWYPWHS
jgi:hypothetical protein